jgi:anti-sigma B factor antagonist
MRLAGSPLVVAFPAEVDLCSAAGLGERLHSVMSPGSPVVVVDLSQTGFLDCAGARMLVGAHARACEQGIELRVAAPCGLVARLFEILGVDRVLRIYPTVPAALLS